MADTRKNPTRPFVGVGAVAFQGDRVLLIKRGRPPRENEWSLPGGGQKLGETIRDAVIREVKEETGLTVKVDALLDAVDFIERDQDAVAFHYTLIDFSAEVVGGDLMAGSDAVDAHFFSLEEVLALPLWTETKRVIELAAKKRGLL